MVRERVNKILVDMLRMYVTHQQRKWEEAGAAKEATPIGASNHRKRDELKLVNEFEWVGGFEWMGEFEWVGEFESVNEFDRARGLE